MSLFKKKKICVTHDGTFHADDLFATAAIHILNNGNIKVIRTRDKNIIAKGDYVYDVGGENDLEKNRFDHHQKGGGGIRENGIPYAAIGLVWKAYGEKICGGDKDIAERIEHKIVQPIDATDVGFDVYDSKVKNIHPYGVEAIFLSEIPTWKEKHNGNLDKIFKRQLKKVVALLKREIKIAKDDIDGIRTLMNDYNNSTDKRIIISSNDFPRYLLQDTLSRLPEPIYLVYPSSKSSTWKVEAIKKSPNTMESRKPFPLEWRGFMDKDEKLREITGVSDIIFCHQVGFYSTTETKEGAIKLAEKALLA